MELMNRDDRSDLSLLLVGVDGSENSMEALAWAAQLAAALDAEVLAIHALGLLEGLTRDEVVEQFESRWCAPLDRSEGRSRRRIVDGPPATTLLRIAREEPVDLMVVGSRGIGGMAELQLGSTSYQLVQNAPVPVTVVPPSSANRAIVTNDT